MLASGYLKVESYIIDGDTEKRNMMKKLIFKGETKDGRILKLRIMIFENL